MGMEGNKIKKTMHQSTSNISNNSSKIVSLTLLLTTAKKISYKFSENEQEAKKKFYVSLTGLQQ